MIGANVHGKRTALGKFRWIETRNLAATMPEFPYHMIGYLVARICQHQYEAITCFSLTHVPRPFGSV
jgi:hypothetical protein